LLHGERGTAAFLDGEALQRRARLQGLRFDPSGDLIRLTSEADHQHRREVGMQHIARQRAAQHAQAFAVGIERAAGAVGQRYPSIFG
jgi:hypothetical protein